MGRVLAREVRTGDVEYLTAHLREADREEILASHGEDADIAQLIHQSVSMSTDVFAAERDGRLIALWGFVPLSLVSGVGVPWALGTDEMFSIGRSLTRLAQASLAVMSATYPTLRNYVDARNTRSIEWLKFIGFEIGEPVPYGAAGLPFHPFGMN